MNEEIFTGKAEYYAKPLPSYPDAAIDYIISLVLPNSVFVDVGVGTGKLAEFIAKKGNLIFAV